MATAGTISPDQAMMLYRAGCVLSSAIWVAVAAYKLTHFDRVVAGIREHKLPLPIAAYWISIAMEIGGALMVASGWLVAEGATLWLVFLLIATPVYHGRIIRDGVIDYQQYVQVFKNITIAGGLLLLLAIDLGMRS